MGKLVSVVGAALVAAVLLLWATGVWTPLGETEERTREEGGAAAALAGGEASPATTTAPAAPALAGREAPAPAEPPRAAVTGPRITGLVVDAGGRPVPGARVIATGDTNGTTFSAEQAGAEGAPTRVTTADAEGRFVVPVPPEAPFHLLWADAPGRGHALQSAVAPGADVVLALEPPVALVGVVKDLEGKPVAGARLKAQVLLDLRRLEVETVSGPDGAYRLEDLPSAANRPGRPWRGYFLVAYALVEAEGYAPLFVGEILATAAPPEHRQDFTLVRGATLVGRVEEGDTGRPVAGATVALHSIEGMQGFGRGNGVRFTTPYAPRPLGRTTTGPDGTFAFEHVPCAGPHGSASRNASRSGRFALGGVVAWAPGFSSAAEGVDVGQDGERMEVTLKVWPAAALEGRVVDADGTPRGNVTVAAKVEGRESKGWIPPFLEGLPRSYATSEEGTGRFRIEGVPASASAPTEAAITLYPRHAGRRAAGAPQPVPSKATVRAGETLDLGDLRLAAVDLLPVTTVVVLRPDGSPYFGAEVHRGFMGNPPRTDAAGRAEWAWGRPRDGKPLPEVAAVVRAPGFAPTPVTLHPPGSGKEEVVVTLETAHRVAGQVLGADGSPAVSVTVSIGDGAVPIGDLFRDAGPGFVPPGFDVPAGRSLPLAYGTAQTDEQGRFAFEDLPDGPYHLLASRSLRVPDPARPGGLRTTASGVAADRDDVVLRLPADDSPETGSLEGTVVEAGSGKPVAATQVLVLHGKQAVASASGRANRGIPAPPSPSRIDADGAFRLVGVPVGTYSLRVEAQGFRARVLEGIVVRAGETTRLPPVEVDRGAAVAGRVVPPARTDIASAGYGIWFRRDGSSGSRVALAKDGSFRVSGLDAGTWRPVVTVELWGEKAPPPLVPARGEAVTVAEGDGEVRFDVTWAAAGTVNLRPMDPRLPPVPFDAGRRATAEQRAFSDGCRVVVRAADGAVVLDQTGGVHQGWAGEAGYLWLLPGRYVARLEMPGGEVREETIDLAAGATADVTWKAR